jgi:hypothetical protein
MTEVRSFVGRCAPPLLLVLLFLRYDGEDTVGWTFGGRNENEDGRDPGVVVGVGDDTVGSN